MPSYRTLLCGAAMLFAAALVFSCASSGIFKNVDYAAEQRQYAQSIDLLESKKKSLYSANRDTVLYCLDKGMLSHYAGLYRESSQLLEDGERAIEAAFTKSVSREVSSYLLNDNVREYAGEDYEDIYVNVFNALNYYHRGEIDEAMVEIRRMNIKLEQLAAKYGAYVSDLQKQALAEGLAEIPSSPGASSQFSDSALARYLGMLFYRGGGLYDDARIDSEALRLVFANNSALYRYPPPASLVGELDIPEGKARFNVVAFSGLAPVKRSQTLRIPLPGPRWMKIALPEMEMRPSSVEWIEVVFDQGQRFRLELLEQIDAVAAETFKNRRNVVYLKSIIRALIKGGSSSALEIASEKTEGNTSLVLGILSIAAQIFAEASEQADLRGTRYFPAKVHVGGINLEPGVYSFTIKYLNRGGEVASVRYNNMRITERALNLAEAVCLK